MAFEHRGTRGDRVRELARFGTGAASLSGYTQEYLSGEFAALGRATPCGRAVGTCGARYGRMALSRSAVSIDYFADSEWIDRAPLMVQTALLNSFENSKAITAIDRESVGLRADLILKTDIRHFEALYNSSNGVPEVWVAISARLVNPSGRDVVAHASFERREQAKGNNIAQVVIAFDEALGGVMEDIVLWTVRNPAFSVKRHPV